MTDSSSIAFGIEEEFFIEGSVNGRCPSLQQMDLVFGKLAERQDWSILQLPNTGCTWDSPHGGVGIWNDFSTNVLEIAYPVLDRPDQLIELRERVFDMLLPALKSADLSIAEGAVGFRRPDEIVLRPAPSPEYQIRLERDIQREPNGRELFCPYFYANICSTQVSFSISKSKWAQSVAGMYEYEHLIPLLYSRPIQTQGKSYRCLRHFILNDNWPEDQYVGYPKNISELVSGAELQPEPRTFKYANCVFRKPKRVEFRSCDRLETSQEILEMTCLRMLTLAAASKFKPSDDETHFRQLYFAACLDGTICTKTVRNQLERLKSILSAEQEIIPQQFWGDYAESLLQKLNVLGGGSVGSRHNAFGP